MYPRSISGIIKPGFLDGKAQDRFIKELNTDFLINFRSISYKGFLEDYRKNFREIFGKIPEKFAKELITQPIDMDGDTIFYDDRRIDELVR